jgi:hypothetical protein
MALTVPKEEFFDPEEDRSMLINGRETRSLSSATVAIALLALASVAAFLLLKGHGYHLLAYAPLLILAACPFLHMGLHGRHGAHQSEDISEQKHRDM